MRSVARTVAISVMAAGAALSACGADQNKPPIAISPDAVPALAMYFHEVADVGRDYQANRLKTADPLDPYSADIPPLIDDAANFLALIEAPPAVAGLHGDYTKSVKVFAQASAALSARHDEIAALIGGATPSDELLSALGASDSADAAVSDACLRLQAVANTNKIDVDIGCRSGTPEFRCYGTNASGSSNASSFDDARERVQGYAGVNAPIPTNFPAWVRDFQVSTYTHPTEAGDPESGGIVFANYDDLGRPQVTLAFIPRPFCGRRNRTVEAHAIVGETDLSIYSLNAGGALIGVQTTLPLAHGVVNVRVTWDSGHAPPSYAAMVPTIVEWVQLVIDAEVAS